MKLTLSNISLAAQVRPGSLGGGGGPALSTLSYSNFTEQSITPYVHQVGFTCTGMDVSSGGTDTISIGWALTSNAQHWSSVIYSTGNADWTRNGNDFTYTWNTHNLQAGTTYYWKIFGTDYDTGSAVSIISTVQNFTTAYILTAPTNLTVSIVQDGSTGLLRAPTSVSYVLTQNTVGLRAPTGLTSAISRVSAPSNVSVSIVQDGASGLLRAPSGVSFSLTQNTVGLRAPSGLSVSLTQNTVAFAGLVWSNLSSGANDFIEFDDYSGMTSAIDSLYSPSNFQGNYLKYTNETNMMADIASAFGTSFGTGGMGVGQLYAINSGTIEYDSNMNPVAYVFCGSGSTVSASNSLTTASGGTVCMPIVYQIPTSNNTGGPLWGVTILYADSSTGNHEESADVDGRYTMETAAIMFGDGTSNLTQTGFTAQGQQGFTLNSSAFTGDQS